MKPIEEARAKLNAEQAKGEHSEWMKDFGLVLDAGVKLKKITVERKMTRAKTECPKCHVRAALQGYLVIGPAAGRHGRSGGAFRMWCETPGCQMSMME